MLVLCHGSRSTWDLGKNSKLRLTSQPYLLFSCHDFTHSLNIYRKFNGLKLGMASSHFKIVDN